MARACSGTEAARLTSTPTETTPTGSSTWGAADWGDCPGKAWFRKQKSPPLRLRSTRPRRAEGQRHKGPACYNSPLPTGNCEERAAREVPPRVLSGA
jgi:hypothetical protein